MKHTVACPRVSVLIPCYNARRWISRAIISVQRDPYPDIEIVVVDDLSTDGSLQFVSETHSSVRMDGGVKRGAAGTRNRAAEISTGEFLVFLDADDFYDPSPIGSMVRSMTAENADLCVCPCAIEKANGIRETKRTFGAGIEPERLLAEVVGAGWAPLLGIMWRRSFFDAIGAWREDLPRNEDGELMARAALACPRVAAANGGLAVYFQHDSIDRVSSQRSPEAIESALDGMRALLGAIEGTRFEYARPTLGNKAYELAAEAFSLGYWPLGREAYRLSRSLSFHGHRGSAAHRLVSTLVSLEGKARLSRAARGVLGK